MPKNCIFEHVAVRGVLFEQNNPKVSDYLRLKYRWK